MDSMNWSPEMRQALKAAIGAGEEILHVYGSGFSVEQKEDKSPLTEADKRGHEYIVQVLANTPYPILSEEGKAIPYAERSQWERFWLVDPLDGTKEFIKRNGEFTVNIALIEGGRPIGGVIYVPVLDELYMAHEGVGAFWVGEVRGKSEDELMDAWVKLPKEQNRESFVVVGSRSHMSPETSEYVDQLRQEKGAVEVVSKGSSLKLCMVAEGVADEYPRFAPTMEWDTAAGHAICSAAGFSVLQYPEMTDLRYNKENLLNPWFIVK